ncbi:unnamed protein product [Symbiodinium sp. CCMP2456]|nr:unnamed protein product [Symbiodinium sp. CCMP2456]
MLRTVAISLVLAADAAAAEAALPAPGPLSCSACLWAAKALRAALLEKMPKRVKAKQRRLLAEKALAGSGAADAGACAQRRFSKQVVLWVPPSGQSPPSYQDFNDVRGGNSHSLTSEHFQLLGTSEAAKGNLTELCATLLRTFQEELVDKAARHEGRMYGALTEHWLCFRKAQLCTAKEAPPGKDDDEEEDL